MRQRLENNEECLSGSLVHGMGQGTLASTSHPEQLVACSTSLRIIDAKLYFKSPRIELSVSETRPETSNEIAASAKLNTGKDFILML
jgi:hypothetical protein